MKQTTNINKNEIKSNCRVAISIINEIERCNDERMLRVLRDAVKVATGNLIRSMMK